MSSTVPEPAPNTEPLPSAEELAEARAYLEESRPDAIPYVLLAYLAARVRQYARAGYSPDRNRRALAMVVAYEQLRLEQADALAAELAAARSLDAEPDHGEVGGETVEDAEAES